MKIFRKIIITILSLFIIIIFAFLIYTSNYYKAKDVDSYLKSDDYVIVDSKNNNIWFSPKNEVKEEGFIFYQGALVEKEAYAPIMYKLARDGYTSVLIDMPFKLAFFGTNYASEITLNNKDINWYIGGHSLGGAMAANYYYSHSNSVSGLVLLAAYSTKDLTIKEQSYVLSIYGSCDNVLSKEKYDKYKSNISSNLFEYCIEGANHSGFASYGAQAKDGKNTISKEEQWNITINYIEKFMEKTL